MIIIVILFRHTNLLSTYPCPVLCGFYYYYCIVGAELSRRGGGLSNVCNASTFPRTNIVLTSGVDGDMVSNDLFYIGGTAKLPLKLKPIS